MSAAADRISDPKVRARVQDFENRSEYGEFLYMFSPSTREGPQWSTYRFVFRHETVTYRELGVRR